MSEPIATDRRKRPIALGSRISPTGGYHNISIVEAVGDGIVYTDDGNRYRTDDILIVEQDSPERWMEAASCPPSLYRTLSGLPLGCNTEEEKAEDLLMRSWLMSQEGSLDAYMQEHYNLDQ